MRWPRLREDMIEDLVSTVLFVTSRVQLVGGVVAAILTVITGQWMLFLYALVGSLIGPLALGVGLAPGAVVGFIGACVLGRGKNPVAIILIGVSHQWTMLCVTAWAYAIGNMLVIELAPTGSIAIHLARTLWAYEITTGVLAFMAQRSEDDELAWPVYTIASVASLVFLVVLACTLSPNGALLPLAAIGAVGGVFLTWVAVQRERGAW